MQTTPNSFKSNTSLQYGHQIPSSLANFILVERDTEMNSKPFLRQVARLQLSYQSYDAIVQSFNAWRGSTPFGYRFVYIFSNKYNTILPKKRCNMRSAYTTKKL